MPLFHAILSGLLSRCQAFFPKHTIRAITPSGVAATLAGQKGVAGSADGDAAMARFRNRWGVAVGADGNVIVADHGSHTTRSIDTAGVVTTLGGVAGLPG